MTPKQLRDEANGPWVPGPGEREVGQRYFASWPIEGVVPGVFTLIEQSPATDTNGYYSWRIQWDDGRSAPKLLLEDTFDEWVCVLARPQV